MEGKGLCSQSESLMQSHVSGDAASYQSLTTLARALAQYLVVVSKVPAHLHLPPDKEGDIVKFVVMTLEVRTALKCCVSVRIGYVSSTKMKANS